jgi:hypothetical protein
MSELNGGKNEVAMDRKTTMFRRSLQTAIALIGLACLLVVPPISADILHIDDVIIQFSLCVGNDCVNGESFGFDTQRLKENNLRVHFADTSNSTSFPRNDWRLIANDSSNGGGSYFALEDSTAGRQVFRVEAGAPSNSLYVEDGGRVGFGTSTPVVDAHVKSGNTPTLRLEQDGSSGFTPQTWDVAGNEANFFVRDATNGSKLVFRIKPGAPTDSLFVADDGFVGFGTDDPQAPVEVAPSSGNAALRLNFNGDSNWAISNTGSVVTFNMLGSGGQEVTFRERNDASSLPTLEVQGTAQATQHTNSSSRELKTDFAVLDGRMVLAKLSDLPVSSWRYKTEDESTRHFGPVAEDFKEAFELGDGETISTVDAQGVALAAIQGLHELSRQKENQLASLREDNAALRAEVEELRRLIESMVDVQTD